MITYTLLNTVFFVILTGLYFYARRHVNGRATLIALLLIITLTALFDPIMIAVGLVAYDADKLLGLYWFGAPIEDFAYAIFAVPFVAAVWSRMEHTNVR